MDNKIEKEFMTNEKTTLFKDLFIKNWTSYKNKDISVSDKQWLEEMFKRELSDNDENEIKKYSNEIINSINEFDKNLESVNNAYKNGISKEKWLSDKINESSSGMAVNEYGQILNSVDEMLYQKNSELATALSRHSDGNIKMSPNLDGNIAEHMIANTAELSGHLQGKNVKVEVRDVFTSNSVDVRATNLDTGKYHNYQLKFGKDAQATIELIERGNYNNQKIVVPSEQLDEIQAYFKAKGSSKTITDHIDSFGVKGKSFTKNDMKSLQKQAQEDGIMPEMDYSHYQNKDLAINIGKNASTLALQSMAVTTGFHMANKMFSGENIDPDEILEIAIKTGTDTSIKTVTAGTLQVAIRKGIISFIPKSTPAGVIANIACVGIENIKILSKIAAGELSLTKGIDQMGRTTVSMIGGIAAMAKGAAIGASLTAWVPVIGLPLSVATGLIGGTVGYLAGSKIGETIYNTAKKVGNTVKTIAKSAWNGLKSVGKSVKNFGKKAFDFFFS